ncbi:hypothetical protein [Chloroflexus sp. Y-396-1]|uniref:hypothetical protein n=1 Tax=Chloroflexus sp. Y-396-1 TaxID=867845 RepID=UPI000490829B|nr:hypothetical protein [Chloroflexus sp. Y-396-1]
MRHIRMLYVVLLVVLVVLAGCSTGISAPVPSPAPDQSSLAVPSDSSLPSVTVTAVVRETTSATVPTEIVPVPSVATDTAVDDSYLPTGTPTTTSDTVVGRRPTPIPTVSVLYAPPVPNDVVLPEYDPDVKQMMETMVRCHFPTATYDPQLHRDVMEDIARRFLHGMTSDEYLLAVPYYVDRGLKMEFISIDGEKLRKAVQQRWSCDEILSQDAIQVDDTVTKEEPSVIALFPLDEVYGTILAMLAYE